jgi:hypothetical protein
MNDELEDVLGDPYDSYLARFTGAGNLFPDAAWVRHKKDGTRWTVGEAWTIEAVTASMTAKRGRWRAKLGNTAIALDAFTRSVTDGWGSADTGGAYTLTGTAADFDVDGSVGTIVATAAGIKRAELLSMLVRDVDVTARFALSALPSSGTTTANLSARRIDALNRYRVLLSVDTAGAVTLELYSVVAGSGTLLGSSVATGLTLAAGTFLRVRLQVYGAYPTTVRARAWLDGDEEPTTWTSSATDSSAALQTAGSPGLETTTSSTTLTYSFDDLAAYELPFTVVRDLFTRSVVDGWGSADTGGAYTLGGTAANFDVNGSAGTISTAASTGYSALLAGISRRDTESLVRFAVGTLPNSSTIEYHVLSRYSSLTATYRCRVTVDSTGAVRLRVMQGSTVIGTESVLGFTVAAGDYVWVRLVTDGASPTTVRARAWKNGSAEPGTWDKDTTDSTGPQVAGQVGLRTFGNSYTNGPLLVSVDDYSVIASSSALYLDSDYIACGVQQLYSLAELVELDYSGGTFRTQLREFDASKVFIQTQDLIVYDVDAEWPSVEVGRYAGTAAAPPVSVGIDVEPHADTRHVKVRRVADADSVGTWIIAAQAVIDGPAAQLTSSPDASAEAVVSIDGSGIVIEGGGLRVENAGATVIIDGTSEMFLIQATGTLSMTVGSNNFNSTTVTLTALGTLSAVPACLGMVAPTTTATSVRMADLYWQITDHVFVADSSGGSPTNRVNAPDRLAYLRYYLSASPSGDLIVDFEGWDGIASAYTPLARYYILKQAAV